MNKKLFEKVKGLCKDTGLSEKYLKAITEKMGGSVEDDSTDEAAIETCANLIADVAKESQGEATRWANKKKDPKKDPEPSDGDGNEPNPNPKKDGDGGDNAALLKRIDDMAKELKELKDEKAKGDRSKSITELMAKHQIPKHLQERLAKSISDDEDAEAVISGYKQDLITNGLPTEDSEGTKAASEKQVDEAADSLLESITAK